MDMDSQKFPLRKLPEKALRNVILCMKIGDMIALSFGSKFTKKMVSDLKIEVAEYKRSFGEHVSLDIPLNADSISINLFDLETFGWASENEKIQFRNRLPNYVFVLTATMEEGMPVQDRKTWNKPTYDYRDWVTHMDQLFSYHHAGDYFKFKGAERFDVQSLREEFQEYPYRGVILSENCPGEILQQVYRDLKTYRTFELNGVPQACNQNFEQYCLHNFHEFSMDNHSSLHLDQLTLNGSEIIELKGFTNFSAKMINRFVRSWIKGSNPRLRFVSISVAEGEEMDANQVLKGVPHQNLADEKVEVFQKRVWTSYVRGGTRITSKSGKQATLVLKPKAKAIKTKMEMYVWN